MNAFVVFLLEVVNDKKCLPSYKRKSKVSSAPRKLVAILLATCCGCVGRAP